MDRPLFTVVIPTIGRPTLARTLASIPPDVDTIVVADTLGPLLSDVRATAWEHNARYFELNAGCHSTGSPQLQYGYERAQGRYILNCGDDDVYEPDAFETIARAIEETGVTYPLMFKVEMHPAPHRGNSRPVILWDEPKLERFHITGQCFVTPNDPALLGYWHDDVAFMQATVYWHGERVAWREELIARCY